MDLIGLSKGRGGIVAPFHAIRKTIMMTPITVQRSSHGVQEVSLPRIAAGLCRVEITYAPTA